MRTDPVDTAPWVRTDCRHYRGEKPCDFHRACPGCEQYESQGRRVLIIKLGAPGDVLRTTPLLRALSGEGDNPFVTWVTDCASLPLLEGNPSIQRLWTCDARAWARCQVEEFDLLLSLDKAPEATGLASLVRARARRGFCLTPWGTLGILNPEALYALRLGIDDDLKFRQNARSYQEIIFEACGLPWRGQEYILELRPEEREGARRQLRELGAPEGELRIGLNTGCGAVFATKKWTLEGYVALAEMLHRKLGARVLLLGGPEEEERNREILRRAAVPVVDTGTTNPLRGFAALVGECDLVVTGDTMALHLAIALRVPVVALFGSTCPQEIDLYGRGVKIFRTLPCSPCYKATCDQEEVLACMTRITPEEVFRAACAALGREA